MKSMLIISQMLEPGGWSHLSRESAALLSSYIKNGKLLNIPFGGHEIHKEQAKIVSDLMLTFLKE